MMNTVEIIEKLAIYSKLLGAVGTFIFLVSSFLRLTVVQMFGNYFLAVSSESLLDLVEKSLLAHSKVVSASSISEVRWVSL